MAVRFEEVGYQHRGHWLVRGMEFEVPEGSLFALIGKSGAGKTTTLRLMIGLLQPSEGRVEVLGSSSGRICEHSGRVAVALDPVALHPALSVEQNLRAHASMHGRPARRIGEWLDKLDLGHVRRRKAGRLSQGESQRVNLARALLLEAELLVLDEPLVHLDPASASQALEVLVEEVRGRGASIVLSSHHLAHVERSADRVAFVHRGRLLLQGSLGELLEAHLPWHRVHAEPAEDARRVLEQHPRVLELQDGPRPSEFAVHLELEAAAEVNAALVGAGCRVALIAPVEESLDSLFLRSLEEADRAHLAGSAP